MLLVSFRGSLGEDKFNIYTKFSEFAKEIDDAWIYYYDNISQLTNAHGIFIMNTSEFMKILKVLLFIKEKLEFK